MVPVHARLIDRRTDHVELDHSVELNQFRYRLLAARQLSYVLKKALPCQALVVHLAPHETERRCENVLHHCHELHILLNFLKLTCPARYHVPKEGAHNTVRQAGKFFLMVQKLDELNRPVDGWQFRYLVQTARKCKLPNLCVHSGICPQTFCTTSLGGSTSKDSFVVAIQHWGVSSAQKSDEAEQVHVTSCYESGSHTPAVRRFQLQHGARLSSGPLVSDVATDRVQLMGLVQNNPGPQYIKKGRTQLVAPLVLLFHVDSKFVCQRFVARHHHIVSGAIFRPGIKERLNTLREPAPFGANLLLQSPLLPHTLRHCGIGLNSVFPLRKFDQFPIPLGRSHGTNVGGCTPPPTFTCSLGGG
mmetsp:Transcript_127883/g.221019  ORF Transcript_127883/g.221019 Transcript_127883/m.221019 type:complete len:359 (+) Transcript_127883:768-1844(+)